MIMKTIVAKAYHRQSTCLYTCC